MCETEFLILSKYLQGPLMNLWCRRFRPMRRRCDPDANPDAGGIIQPTSPQNLFLWLLRLRQVRWVSRDLRGRSPANFFIIPSQIPNPNPPRGLAIVCQATKGLPCAPGPLPRTAAPPYHCVALQRLRSRLQPGGAHAARCAGRCAAHLGALRCGSCRRTLTFEHPP